MICSDPSCGCGIVSNSLTITGSGAPGNPYRLETNAYSIVTSVTRPALPFVGQFIWETNTQRQLVWTGAHWLIVGGAMPTWNLTRLVGDAVFPVPTITSTEIPMLNEVEDSDGFHTGTASFITVPTGMGGDYAITGSLQFKNAGLSTIGYRLMQLVVGSNASQPAEVPQVDGAMGQAGNTDNTDVGMAKLVRVEAGAVIKVWAYQNSGVTINLARCWFTGTMVRHIPTLT